MAEDSEHPSEKILRRIPEIKTSNIGIKDLGYVVRVIHNAGLDDRWQQIAQILTVSDSDLAGFGTTFRGDPSSCLLHAMATWLRGQKRLSDPPSWWSLVQAVADEKGGNNLHEATRIAVMFRNCDGLSKFIPISNLAKSTPTIPLVDDFTFSKHIFDDVEDAIDKFSGQLSPVASRWIHIGALLSPDIAFSWLSEQRSSDDRQNLRALMRAWLNSMGDVTLQRLVEAVEHSAGGKDPALARSICDTYAGTTPAPIPPASVPDPPAPGQIRDPIPVSVPNPPLQKIKRVKVLSLEEDRQLAAFKSVIAKKGDLEQTILHCMFIGHPGGGKSSLIKRLTRQPLDPGHVLPSTGVAEKPLLVKVFTSTAAAFASHSAGDGWSILTYHAEAIALFAKAAEDAAATPTPSDEAIDGSTRTLNKVSDGSEVPSIREQHNLPDTFTPAAPSFTLSMSILRRAIEGEGLKKVQQCLQQSFLLYLTDTGGQSEFQELLPALNAGPALFFLVFRLDHDLDTTINIQFRYPDGSRSDPHQSHFTVRESLLRSLASIASMVSYKYSTKQEEVYATLLKPKVLFVGTHLDQISVQKMKQVDDSLQKMVKKTSLYKDGLIEFAVGTEQLVVPVNNLSTDDSDFEQVRSVVRRIANRPGDNYQVSLPSTWFIFSLAIRQHKKSVMSYEECFEIGQQCGIDERTELNSALWFLSNVVGLVRHFKVEGLEEIVIINPQILFNKITQLIFGTFNVSNVTSNVCEEFQNKGIFPRSALQKIEDELQVSKESYSDVAQSENGEASMQPEKLLTVDQFLTLMEHLHIISRLHEADEKYFMPSILLTHAESTAPELPPSSSAIPSTQQVPPLLFTFKCGFCPMGLFGALVVYLLANKMKSELEWELQTDRISRKAITFSVFPHDTVTLRFTPKYLEVEMIPGEEGEREPSVEGVCTHVRSCIETAIQEVTSDLHYMEHAEHELAFYCSHEAGPELYPAKIKYYKNYPSKLCGERGRLFPLCDGYKNWFSKVEPPEIPAPQGGLSVPSTAQARGTVISLGRTPIPVVPPSANTKQPVLPGQGGNTTGGVTFIFTGWNITGGTAMGGGATGGGATGVEGGATGGSAVGGSARGAGGDVHITVVTGGGQPEVAEQFTSVEKVPGPG